MGFFFSEELDFYFYFFPSSSMLHLCSWGGKGAAFLPRPTLLRPATSPHLCLQGVWPLGRLGSLVLARAAAPCWEIPRQMGSDRIRPFPSQAGAMLGMGRSSSDVPADAAFAQHHLCFGARLGLLTPAQHPWDVLRVVLSPAGMELAVGPGLCVSLILQPQQLKPCGYLSGSHHLSSSAAGSSAPLPGLHLTPSSTILLPCLPLHLPGTSFVLSHCFRVKRTGRVLSWNRCLRAARFGNRGITAFLGRSGEAQSSCPGAVTWCRAAGAAACLLRSPESLPWSRAARPHQLMCFMLFWLLRNLAC